MNCCAATFVLLLLLRLVKQQTHFVAWSLAVTSTLIVIFMATQWRTLLTKHDLAGELNKSEAFEILRALRKSNIRRPDIVLKLGPQVERACGDTELWMLNEQMFIAALDMKLDDKADFILQKMLRQFPDSARVKRLQGMQCEARGDYDAALAIYDKLLVDNPGNISVLQRTTATYKALGNFTDALLELNKILEINNADFKIWTEIADLHIRMSNYAEAAFCLEEVILLEPNNHVTHTRLAELYYTLGGLQNVLKARRHYTTSLNKLKVTLNLRAGYGLILCCQSVEDAVKSKPDCVTSEEISVNKALLDWIKVEIKDLLEHSPPSSFIYNGIIASKA